jgi:hypothetical protein
VEDGRCHFGLRRYSALLFLGYDIFFNTALTLVFICLLGPAMRSNVCTQRSFGSRLAIRLCMCCGLDREEKVQLHTSNPQVAKRLDDLLWRTFAGFCLVLVSTVANLTQLAVVTGKEWGYLCLILCTMDGMFMMPKLFHKALTA